MKITAERRETAKGPAVYVTASDRTAAVVGEPLNGDVHSMAISLWEGIVGLPPDRGYWRKRAYWRGLKRLEGDIARVIEELS